VLDAIDNKVIPEGWNDTIIVLIPKIDDPILISQYRPISLCNVIYKVISKMIAFRFKHVLDEVIPLFKVLLCLEESLLIIFLLLMSASIPSRTTRRENQVC
jgi:hypothetical protein